MRIILALFSLILLSAGITTLNNKLQNTRWSGIIMAPAPTEAVLEFRKDSSFIWVNNTIIETMNYTVSGDTLTLTKLNGSSPCNAEKAVYKFSITNNVLKVTAVNDDCPGRVAAWDEAGYIKQ